MGLQEIELIIDASGNVQVKVRGVAGMSCLDLTAELERALGGEIASREMTPEAYPSDETEAQDWQWQGNG